MRLRYLAVAIVAAVTLNLVAATSQSLSQPPSKGDGKREGGEGEKKKGMRGGFNPTDIFDKLKKDRDHFLISELPWGKDEMTFWAEKNGIKDGKISKDNYLKYWEIKDDVRKQMREAGEKGGKDTKTDSGDSDESRFKGYDTNKDGKLSENEISVTKNLKNEWKKWDKNGDSHLDLAEFKAFSADFYSRGEQGRKVELKASDLKMVIVDPKVEKKAETPGKVEVDEIEGRPVVYRLGKLPPGMPSWFVELDKHQADGQITMFEWRKGGKALEDFQAIDRNDDGIITIDEVMRHVAQPKTAARPTTPAEEGSGPSFSSRSGTDGSATQEQKKGKKKGRG